MRFSAAIETKTPLRTAAYAPDRPAFQMPGASEARQPQTQPACEPPQDLDQRVRETGEW